MGATFSRVKTWVAEVLLHTDLNAEFDNILTNLTPAGMDDESATTTAMRATADPYPGSVESLATSLQGEIQRLRYLIQQLTGKTYWYQDPTTFGTAAYLDVGTGASKVVQMTSGAKLPAVDGSLLTNLTALTIASNTQTDDYTLVIGDAGKVVVMNKATTVTLTVPPNSGVAFVADTRIDVVQYGAGKVTIAAGIGVTIRSQAGLLSIAEQYVGVTLMKYGTDEWILFGQLVT